MVKKVLITFGHPEEYQKCGEYLKNSAKDYFDEIRVYNKACIDSAFYNKNIKIFDQKRGFGYWLWKPYFIQKTLNELNENDLLFYSDARVVFNADPKQMLDLAQEKKSLLFHVPGNHLNKTWTKYETFFAMIQAKDTNKYLDGRQTNGAFQLYTKTKDNIDFVEEYLKYCQNEVCISDQNFMGFNLNTFKDHRHDQSILSILSIKYNKEMFKSPCQFGEQVKSEYTNSPYNQCIFHHRSFIK